MDDGRGNGPLAPFAWRPVAIVVAVVVAVLGVTATGYGYHRDELYFRLLSAHPAWSYVDEPPMTPMLVRASTSVFGDSLWALRIPAITCAAVTVLLVALLCRELGGGRLAQVLAAVGVSSTFLLIAGHVFLTASPDMVFWTLTILFVVRALLREQPRWWVYAGVSVGVGLYNKQLIVLLLIGIAVGLLICGPRRILASRWIWMSMLIAVVIAAPTLIYQVRNHFPELHMARALSADKGHDDRIDYIPFQILLLGLTLVPIWVSGLIGLFRQSQWRPIRALGWAYVVVSVIVLGTGGQVYYTFGLLALYYAVGCVRVERWVADGGRSRPVWVTAALVVSVAVAAVLALPLVPVASLRATGIGQINQTVRDQIGWPAYVRQVGAAFAALPAADRAHTTLIAENYGEAGALDRFGSAYALPAVYSGQNQLFDYGPPPASATTVLFVGLDRSAVTGDFASCQQVGTLDNGVGVDNEEQGRPILVCRTPRERWSVLWPSFQHYG